MVTRTIKILFNFITFEINFHTASIQILNKLKLHYINCENDLKKFDKLQQNNKKKFIFSNLLTF